MTSTFHGIEIGKRGLAAQQTALSTTGQNISNANTIGYTRQRAEMQATPSISSNGLQLGTGVDVNSLVRLREEYLDVQFRGENKNLGYWEAKSDTLGRIEELMNEPSDDGLAFTMDEFWKSWQELAKNPDSEAARGVVRQKAVAVTETFKHISDSLDQMQDDLKNVINAKTTEINSLAAQIGNLNDQISRLVANNYQPNDLYDQRDVLIDQLSKLVNVKVTPNANGNGMVDISAGSGVLVTGKTANTLSIDFDQTTGLVNPDEIKINGSKVTVESGELLGRIESFGILGGGSKSTIPSMKDQINKLAETFVQAVNDVHHNGLYLINNNGQLDTASAKDIDFFTGTTAKDLMVNPDIMNNLNLIAAAKEEIPGSGKSSPGNGKNAQEMTNIKSIVGDMYRSIIGQLGIDSQEAGRMLDNSEVIVNQVENRRQSVSGVSLDEEMANMIKFQQAYNAAARMVTAMDQCLDKVINGMGRVGL
ncbi:flagellar hook-associated protein FlgK [Neobacillus vireti]|uniref:Flagellar hook-associated protein 1 n=1 Tax=Neobacillus vireti LMG 21834 TaxID=1131730 RepID=A0AB94IQU8_9BACI|nr:flagellar hook-associated protein FlgK [Neobacillus vireti]ETI69357.1 flagellar hook-associated protein 1 [Neobacillus vireti LMG 21834]KLT19819.1 flagellar hook protein [Neobacillus vireti]